MPHSLVNFHIYMFVCVDVNASEHAFVCACVGQSNLCVHSWLLVSMYIYVCVCDNVCLHTCAYGIHVCGHIAYISVRMHGAYIAI